MFSDRVIIVYFQEALNKKERKNNIEQLEEKYTKLLLNKCINFDKSKSLFINYDVVNKKFVDKVVKYAKNRCN